MVLLPIPAPALYGGHLDAEYHHSHDVPEGEKREAGLPQSWFGALFGTYCSNQQAPNPNPPPTDVRLNTEYSDRRHS